MKVQATGRSHGTGWCQGRDGQDEGFLKLKQAVADEVDNLKKAGYKSARVHKF
jgi:hypothetical protein